jgi:hypothetical protein
LQNERVSPGRATPNFIERSQQVNVIGHTTDCEPLAFILVEDASNVLIEPFSNVFRNHRTALFGAKDDVAMEGRE